MVEVKDDRELVSSILKLHGERMRSGQKLVAKVDIVIILLYDVGRRNVGNHKTVVSAVCESVPEDQEILTSGRATNIIL